MPKLKPDKSEKGAAKKKSDIVFPPQGYRPTPLNALLANALDLSAPASVVLLTNRKTAWIQLAGHPDFFAPASPETIWKKQPNREASEGRIYRSLLCDSVCDIVPKFHREVEYNGNIFIEMEDLLQHFSDPNIMDIKMGTRTFLEAEVSNDKLRADLYKKMVAVNPSAPTAEERKKGAITKLRYMEFRERCSSSAELGFRIDAIRFAGQQPIKDLKTVCSKQQVMDTVHKFVCGKQSVCRSLLARLHEMRSRFEASRFFRHNELIGSSLLVMYDHLNYANIWMIDFAKTMVVPNLTLSHRTAWRPGTHEDGYLTGVDNLILIMQELAGQTTSSSSGEETMVTETSCSDVCTNGDISNNDTSLQHSSAT